MEKENEKITEIIQENNRMRKPFRDGLDILERRIKKAKEDLVDIHKMMNERDCKIVEDITKMISDTVYKTHVYSEGVFSSSHNYNN